MTTEPWGFFVESGYGVIGMNRCRPNLQYCLEQQKRRLREMLQQSEVAKAREAEVKDWISLIGRTGMADGQVALGKEILSLRYKPCEGGHDSGSCYQAALIIPEGIGVIELDSEEYASLIEVIDGLESNAAATFRPLQKCSPVIQNWLYPQIDDLVEKMMMMLPTELAMNCPRNCLRMSTNVYLYRRHI